MRLNEHPLGYSNKKILQNGDLVTWKNWKIVEKKLLTEVNYGTILQIYTEMRGQREVYVAEILCSNSGETITVNLLRLEKKETT